MPDFQIEEIKTFDVRVRDFQRIAKDLESNHSTLKRELEELHLLSEHIDNKTLLIVKAGLQLSFKISKHIEPLELILG